MEENIALVITALQQLVCLLTVDRIRKPLKLRQRKKRVTKLKQTAQLLVLLLSCSQLVPFYALSWKEAPSFPSAE